MATSGAGGAHADWRWLAVAVATGFLGIVASAVTILGSSRTALPVGKTMAVQLAAAFTGRTTAAGIGFYGINVAYLERLGSRRTQAVAVVLLNRAVVGVITGIATAIGVLVIGSAVPVGGVSIPTGWPVILLAVVVVAAAAVFLTLPVGRRLVWGPVRSMLRELVRDLVPTLRRPVRALQPGGGAIVFLVLQAVGLAATLAAFEPTFPLIPVMAVYVVASTLGQLAPTPGALGAGRGRRAHLMAAPLLAARSTRGGGVPAAPAPRRRMSAHPLKDFRLVRPTSTTVSPASRRSTTEPRRSSGSVLHEVSRRVTGRSGGWNGRWQSSGPDRSRRGPRC